MAKVAGSYESVILGVSEQVPQERRSGQHFAQANMISDPVRGLARRHGSVFLNASKFSTDATKVSTYETDSDQAEVFSFFINGREYDLIYRTQASLGGKEGFIHCFDKEAKQFVPVQFSDDAVIDALVSGGVSAVTNIGKYLFIAGKTITPAYSPFAAFESVTNRQHLAGWVRQGAYARTFKVDLVRQDGSLVSASYTTKTNSYPGTLDTSDIPLTNPDGTNNNDYQKLVNDRVNAYTSEQTKWIGEAAKDIAPANIARKLQEALNIAPGIPAGTPVDVRNSTIIISHPDFKEIVVDDGGDGTLFRGVGGEIPSAELVSTIHAAGKVVKVRPKTSNGSDAYYLKAFPKNTDTTNGFSEVIWRETAGYEVTPTAVFCTATIIGGTLMIGGTPAALDGLTGVASPAFKANAVGDDITCPIPYFFGKTISYLGVFQDRLVIGAGSVLLFSKPGDYFNWFRGSVLLIADDDPVEMYSLGSEDDTISRSVTYDRNLWLFGYRKQYVVSGRVPLTPKSASIVVTSAYEEAVDAAPVNSGNYGFYGKSRNGTTTLHQIQTGLIADSPESIEITQQLDTYIKGKPKQIVATTAPDMLFLRVCNAARNRVYTYSYLDQNNQRAFDSWSHWEWDERLGVLSGISTYDGQIIMYFIRHNASGVYIAAEQFTLETNLSYTPYLDSQRPYPNNDPDWSDDFEAVGYVALDKRTDRYMLGTTYDRRTELDPFLDYAWVGYGYTACFTPTNPYRRDRNEKPIVDGRLTLNRVSIVVSDTGGAVISVKDLNGDKIVTNFSGRVLGDEANLIGQQPIVSTEITGRVGREIRKCSYTVKSKLWLPLTVTGIDWRGQWFYNTRRV